MKVSDIDVNNNSFVEYKSRFRSLSCGDIPNNKSNEEEKFTNEIVPINSLLSEHSIALLSQHEDIVHKPKINKLLLAGTALCGIGTGCAMMPIFNYELRNLENFGIDVHQSEAFFIASTINTLMMITAQCTIELYHYFNNKHDIGHFDSTQNKCLQITKVGSVVSSLLPVVLLWNIEINDQKVSESHGFDEFMQWATFTMIPLLIFKIVEIYEAMTKVIGGAYKDINLNSIGSKLITYGTTALSTIARGISYSAATEELAKNIGFEEETAKTIGIVIGGVLGSVIPAITEHNTMKSMFKPQEYQLTKTDIAIGTLASLEGAWFALPTVSVGLKATSNWNLLLRFGLFTPYFVNKAVSEANNIYNTYKITKPNINI